VSDILAIQKYIKVQREMDYINFKQKFIEEERNMYLYMDKIVTKHHEFPLNNIYDLSFKPFGKAGGILYIHTNNGVFTYNVDSDATEFINTFKQFQQN